MSEDTFTAKRLIKAQEARMSELQTAIEELIYSYVGNISLAEAIGVLEIVKKNIIQREE